jgi:hypothetical protein
LIAILAVVAACSSSPAGVEAPAATTANPPSAGAPASQTAEATPAPEITPAPTPTQLANDRAAEPCLTESSGGPYLATNGRALTCRGDPVELTGYTFYPALVGGARAWADPGFPTYIDHALQMGRASGQNLIRATDQWDKHAQGQRYDDPVIWSNMDYLVNAARREGMFVVIDLSAYRWLLVSQGRDIWSVASWTTFIDFVAARYRDVSNVAFYSILGEPAVPTNSAELDSLLAFYRSTTEALRAADPNHLITAGGFNHMEDSPQLGWWQEIDSLPGNDIVAFKTYSQHDLNLMPTISRFAASIGKPAVDEEFGMPQQYGDSTFSGGSQYNGLSTGRAPFFSAVYSTGISLGVAGFVFWNMGCQVGSTSYEVSPMTPAVWSVVTSYGAIASATDVSAGSVCP